MNSRLQIHPQPAACHDDPLAGLREILRITPAASPGMTHRDGRNVRCRIKLPISPNISSRTSAGHGEI
jgi:hypothetical protein